MCRILYDLPSIFPPCQAHVMAEQLLKRGGIMRQYRFKRQPSRLRRWVGIFLALLLVVGYFTPPAQALRMLPDQLSVTAGHGQAWILGLPFSIRVESGDVSVLSSSDETLEGRTASTVKLTGNQVGSAKLSLNLLGLFPLKKVEVSVEPERILIPGGQAIGVALQTEGVLVVGTSDLGGSVGDSPARLAGIRPGDVILKIGGQPITSAAHLSQLVAQGNGQPIIIGLTRDNQPLEVSLTPKKDEASGTYRLGMWIRDSTAGVGTLSYYDPSNGAYGALGHAITDADTGKPLTVGQGEVLKADVVDVQKGQKGTPGELKGSFLRDKKTLGNILKNTNYGIYGKLDSAPQNNIYSSGLPIGLRSSVHTGPATILSSVDGNGVQEYQVEITKVATQNTPTPKSMVLKVTDPVLLEKTGGIVQGMSGSPIIQDGHLIGAVTHVYVNDPTQGYGLFIEWMLNQSSGI